MTDPIIIAVLQNRLNTIAEEMGEAMLRGPNGASHDYKLLALGAFPRELKSNEINVPVPSGSVIHVLSGSGVGWGDPTLRDPRAGQAGTARDRHDPGQFALGDDARNATQRKPVSLKDAQCNDAASPNDH